MGFCLTNSLLLECSGESNLQLNQKSDELSWAEVKFNTVLLTLYLACDFNKTAKRKENPKKGGTPNDPKQEQGLKINLKKKYWGPHGQTKRRTNTFIEPWGGNLFLVLIPISTNKQLLIEISTKTEKNGVLFFGTYKYSGTYKYPIFHKYLANYLFVISSYLLIKKT